MGARRSTPGKYPNETMRWGEEGWVGGEQYFLCPVQQRDGRSVITLVPKKVSAVERWELVRSGCIEGRFCDKEYYGECF